MDSYNANSTETSIFCPRFFIAPESTPSNILSSLLTLWLITYYYYVISISTCIFHVTRRRRFLHLLNPLRKGSSYDYHYTIIRDFITRISLSGSSEHRSFRVVHLVFLVRRRRVNSHLCTRKQFFTVSVLPLKYPSRFSILVLFPVL